MALTFAQVKSAVQALGYNSDSSTAQTEMCKSVLRRVLGLKRWEFLEDTGTAALAAGSDSVAVATVSGAALGNRIDAVRLFAVGETGDDDLEFVSYQQLRGLRKRDNTPARPSYWSRRGDSILLDCIADQAYTLDVDYLHDAAAPADDTTPVSYFPDAYMDVLVWGVAKQLAHRQRDWSAAAAADAEYQARLTEMIGEYALPQRQTSRQVARWEGFDDEYGAVC